MREVERRVAVARFFEIDQHGAAVAADQEVAGVAVESDQAARRTRGLFTALRKLCACRVDQRARARRQRGGIEKCGLHVDLGAQRGQRIGGVDQRRACRGGGQRQAVDRSKGLGDRSQIVGQTRRAADDLLHQQTAARQGRAHRQRALDPRHMAARCRALIARRFIGEVRRSVEAHLALLGQSRQQAAADEAHVMVSEALVAEHLERRFGERRARVLQGLAQRAGDERVHSHPGGRCTRSAASSMSCTVGNSVWRSAACARRSRVTAITALVLHGIASNSDGSTRRRPISA